MAARARVYAKGGYRNLKLRGNRFFRAVTRGWTPAMHESLA